MDVVTAPPFSPQLSEDFQFGSYCGGCTTICGGGPAGILMGCIGWPASTTGFLLIGASLPRSRSVMKTGGLWLSPCQIFLVSKKESRRLSDDFEVAEAGIRENCAETLGERLLCAVGLTTHGTTGEGVAECAPTPWGEISPLGYRPCVFFVGAPAATIAPTLTNALPSPVFSGFICAKPALFAIPLPPVCSAPPKRNPSTRETNLRNRSGNQGNRGACPVGSTRFTGSPTQYIYEFNPPLPKGLQLSGL